MDEITRSVGSGGINRKDDVATVQRLFNRGRRKSGIPREDLLVDGIVGPKTLAAIRDFQKKYLGKVDGVVEPHKQTIHKLNEIAGPLPELNDGVSYLEPKGPLGWA
jgi:peptidoglycan hydrolase-like protein with peptidoglycan-binding domain